LNQKILIYVISETTATISSNLFEKLSKNKSNDGNPGDIAKTKTWAVKFISSKQANEQKAQKRL